MYGLLNADGYIWIGTGRGGRWGAGVGGNGAGAEIDSGKSRGAGGRWVRRQTRLLLL